jgi:predicted cobalt transporter CbtA
MVPLGGGLGSRGQDNQSLRIAALEKELTGGIICAAAGFLAVRLGPRLGVSPDLDHRSS